MVMVSCPGAWMAMALFPSMEMAALLQPISIARSIPWEFTRVKAAVSSVVELDCSSSDKGLPWPLFSAI